MGVGGLARSVSWLRSEADASLSMVTIRILYPCFIFFHILENENSKIDESTLFITGFGFISILLGFGLSWLISKIFQFDADVANFSFLFGNLQLWFYCNTSSISFFPKIVVHFIFFNLGVEIAIWSFGVLLLTADKLRLKGLLNPPAIAVILAILIQYLGGKQLIPSLFGQL